MRERNDAMETDKALVKSLYEIAGEIKTLRKAIDRQTVCLTKLLQASIMMDHPGSFCDDDDLLGKASPDEDSDESNQG